MYDDGIKSTNIHPKLKRVGCDYAQQISRKSFRLDLASILEESSGFDPATAG
jgi:hypothetical protein